MEKTASPVSRESLSVRFKAAHPRTVRSARRGRTTANSALPAPTLPAQVVEDDAPNTHMHSVYVYLYIKYQLKTTFFWALGCAPKATRPKQRSAWRCAPEKRRFAAVARASGWSLSTKERAAGWSFRTSVLKNALLVGRSCIKERAAGWFLY